MKAIFRLSELFISSFRFRLFFSFLIYSILSLPAFSQCPGGYITSKIDWDNRGYIHRTFITDPYITNALVQTQYFAMGKATRVTINSTHPCTNVTSTNGILGADSLHTGETGSFGTKKDLHYKYNGTITITFDAAVSNVKFSIYDIDYAQRVTVTALNGATPQVITMTKMATSILTVTGSGTTIANAKEATGTAVAALNATTGNINVSIAGPLTSITISMTETGTKTSGSASSQEDGSSWLSDIEACVLNTPFPTSYHSPYTQPFTGQPAYFLAAHQADSSVYMINSTTGVADLLFVDPFLGGTTSGHVNSLAYDPVNKIIYYVRSNSTLTGAGYKTLMKYDATTETISTAIEDLNTLGIAVGGQGISGASASFYDGALYLGIEVFQGCNCPSLSAVWRIDFDGTLNAVKATMVFAKPNGDYYSTDMYNWGDITLKDGILYSLSNYTNNGGFNGESMVHFNLLTGAETDYKTSGIGYGGQIGQTWNGKIFKVWNSIHEYNGTGGWISNIPIGANSCSPVYDTTWQGTSTDASDPFRPKCDFGDAPGTYDPVALSPAVHQKHCNNAVLRLGTTWDREWSKNTSSNASGDATDEDGISTVTILNSNGVSYNHVQQVTVTNNTGANAILGGWLDYNADGVFTASEGRIVTVPSTGSGTQTVNLTWNGLTIPTSTPNTFLRIRLVSGSTPMTTANFTGWYDDGEVEDYPVVSNNIPLSINLLDFTVHVNADKSVALKWTATNDNEADGFEVQHSTDQNNWTVIGWKTAGLPNSITNYYHSDMNPSAGTNFYRLLMKNKNGISTYSNIKSVYLDYAKNDIRIAPNPVRKNASVFFTGNYNTSAKLNILNLSGQVLSSRVISVKAGENFYPVDVSLLSQGVYIIEISLPEKSFTNKLMVY
jgi:hypothetical protein